MEEAIVMLATGLALAGAAATIGWQRVGEARRRITELEGELSHERAWRMARAVGDACRPSVAVVLELLGRRPG